MNAAERRAKLKEFTDNPDTACRTGIPITYHGGIIIIRRICNSTGVFGVQPIQWSYRKCS